MYVKYDEYSLLELFESEPIEKEAEVEIYEYSKKNDQGFELFLHFSVYDQTAIVTLKDSRHEFSIVDISLENVVEIKAHQNKLEIFRAGHLEDVFQVSFTPNFSFNISIF